MKLCACNHCGRILEDTNPQIEAKEYPDEIPIQSLQKFYTIISEPETGYWGCPGCCTDSGLTDDIENHVEQNQAELLVGLMMHEDKGSIKARDLALLITSKGLKND